MDKEKKRENFGQNDVKNVCHFACSNINYMNITILIVIIILIYHFIATKMLAK
jgi:hypothetical protein